MLLSIITINYNNAEGLRKTLASVASQTYPHIEHIIVDGGSTDNSVEVIREYESSLASRLKWISEKDTGIYNAMNKGLEIALGRRVVNDDHTSAPMANNQWPIAKTDYIQILNSGDILAAPDVTERMMAALAQQAKGERLEVRGTMDEVKGERLEAKGTMDEAKGERLEVKGAEDSVADNQASTPYTLHSTPTDASSPLASRLENHPTIFYGNMIKEYPNGKRIVDKCLGDRNISTASVREIEWTMYDFIKGTINHNPTYIRRSLYEKYGLYADTLKIVSDWKWFVNAVVFGGEKVFYTPIDVTIFDMTGISETNLIEREKERHGELEKMLPLAILRDYDTLHFPICQYRRLKKHRIWGLVYFFERILFKFEKWGILSN